MSVEVASAGAATTEVDDTALNAATAMTMASKRASPDGGCIAV